MYYADAMIIACTPGKEPAIAEVPSNFVQLIFGGFHLVYVFFALPEFRGPGFTHRAVLEKGRSRISLYRFSLRYITVINYHLEYILQHHLFHLL